MKPTLDVEAHLMAFVDAFVIGVRKERWRLLLSTQRSRSHESSAKLMDALDSRYCKQVDGAWDLDAATQGVYFDFYADPVVLPLEEAKRRGESRDAIFSMIPGKLAIHFSHEGWSWLCQH